MNNSSDAACRMVDHTHNTSTGSIVRSSHPLITGGQWCKSDPKLGSDTACGPKFESLIRIICHDKTSDTVEDNLY